MELRGFNMFVSAYGSEKVWRRLEKVGGGRRFRRLEKVGFGELQATILEGFWGAPEFLIEWLLVPRHEVYQPSPPLPHLLLPSLLPSLSGPRWGHLKSGVYYYYYYCYYCCCSTHFSVTATAVATATAAAATAATATRILRQLLNCYCCDCCCCCYLAILASTAAEVALPDDDDGSDWKEKQAKWPRVCTCDACLGRRPPPLKQ
jgi:hypothetical protein